MAFPPVPVYPKAIDSNYTLFLVHNTAETKLSADNSTWAQEISVVAVAAGKAEIWADNGFGNINGELFYYDSVEKNSSGKVNKLKGCARQLGGTNTTFNKRGTWIRSYVVAEHHNQLVDAILKTQDFIGFNFDTRQSTLDWRIRNLRALDVIFDDYSCPDIDFTFTVIEDDAVKGVLAEYTVGITPPGSINSFRLDFGDGEFTTSDFQGEHRYAVNARIDPVVRVANDKCQIIQTPVERDNPSEPPAEVTGAFTIPIPEVPDVPDFTFVPCDVPEPDILIPPIQTPCFSVEGAGGFPSIIIGPTITMVSQVTITAENPVNITQSVVQIVGGTTIPSIILIDPPIPPTIIIDPPIPPTIVIIPPSSNITFDLDMSEMPRLEVDWGQPPEMAVELTMARSVRTPERFAADPSLIKEFGTEFADLFEVNQTMKVEYEPVGIPSEIMIIPPSKESLRIDTGDLFEKTIRVEMMQPSIPTNIYIHGPESPIPNSISFESHGLPEEIDLVYRGKAIPVEVTGMPKTVTVEMEKKIPDRILVEMPKPIPEEIIVKSNIPNEIILKGPESIPLYMPPDMFLPVKFPDVLPQFELVYKGAPIEMKISIDKILDKEADGKACVMIVPCPTK
jgi:hypothetical protein